VYLYDGEVVFRLELPAHQPSGVVPS